MEDKGHYLKCPCCGEYFHREQAVMDVYCSWSCTTPHYKCKNCGKYFIPEKGISENYCSEECGEDFSSRETKY